MFLCRECLLKGLLNSLMIYDPIGLSLEIDLVFLDDALLVASAL